MAITQMVDDQIKQIRKERAELDKLRAELERWEEELKLREEVQNDDVGAVDDRKEILLKEVDELTTEVKRLRAEREASIETFGGEISKVHAEKQAESTAEIKRLQGEINFLLKGKTELEDKVARLKEQSEELDEKAKHDLTRIMEEKETVIKRARDEREAKLKEINLAHSVAVADLNREKKELEDEITALEQAKTIEWNKVQAEVSRYKTTQLSEIDAQREELLAELEKERANIESMLRAQEHKRLSEMSAERREWEKEILKFQTEKQLILDEIKLAEYDYEKVKADILVNTEKSRLDEEKMLEAYRAEVMAKIEDDAALAAAESKKGIAEEKKRLLAEVASAEKEITGYETKKAAILTEINTLEATFERQKTENDAALEMIRLDKLKEIDEERIESLRQVEELRQERVAALETAFLEKASGLETARSEKLEECLRAIEAAEAKLNGLLLAQTEAQNLLEALRMEAAKIKEENEATTKAAIVTKHFELEKMANDKLTEVEEICTARIKAATERARQIEAEGNARDEKLSAEIAAGTEALLELRRLITAQNIELQQQKDAKLDEIDKLTIEAMEKHSKMKSDKIAEIEQYLESYKNERLRGVQEDIDRQSKLNFKSIEELAELNADYGKRMAALQELSLSIESDMRAMEFKNKQITMLQERNMEVEMFLAQRDAYDSGLNSGDGSGGGAVDNGEDNPDTTERRPLYL